ncbi:hypothetical protein AB0J21_25645 [Streptomyces sp. NPDC049954]|uniref:hypothetical protein n=1 Tax=Streptomyces sp. NPDC049954 TaxID=3155779 RepID=UPI0034156769
MAEAKRLRGRSFEQIMLLGGDAVVEAAPELDVCVMAVEEWRQRNRDAFRGINDFHDAARVDSGVRGKVTGESHPERDLLLPGPGRSR